MRHLLPLLAAALLSGCAGSANPDGTWINQSIIEAARQGGPLREALLAYGPNLEWQLDSRQGLATYSNGFEAPQGRLGAGAQRQWRVDYPGDHHEVLTLQGQQLVQQASTQGPEQHFARPAHAGVSPRSGRVARPAPRALCG